jgi:hypothetical protein
MALHVERTNSLRTPKGTFELEFRGKRTMDSQKKTVHPTHRRIKTRGKNWQETKKEKLCDKRKDFRFSSINLHKTQMMGEGRGRGQDVRSKHQ